jgi:hypothetical protein
MELRGFFGRVSALAAAGTIAVAATAPPLVLEREVFNESGHFEQLLNLGRAASERELVTVAVRGLLGADHQRESGAVDELQAA